MRSVVAACRNPSDSKELHELVAAHGDALSTVKLDVTDEDSIQVHLMYALVPKPSTSCSVMHIHTMETFPRQVIQFIDD